jgi:hypothetical protein
MSAKKKKYLGDDGNSMIPGRKRLTVPLVCVYGDQSERRRVEQEVP